MARRNDKRDRLIESADTLFHQQGVSNTTLANIATICDKCDTYDEVLELL